jgi:hypothetical protein
MAKMEVMRTRPFLRKPLTLRRVFGDKHPPGVKELIVTQNKTPALVSLHAVVSLWHALPGNLPLIPAVNDAPDDVFLSPPAKCSGFLLSSIFFAAAHRDSFKSHAPFPG